MVQPGLETYARRGERVVDQAGSQQAVLRGVRHRVVDHRRESEGVRETEVRDRLSRGNDRKLDLDAGEQITGPCSCRDDAGSRHDLVPVRADAYGAAAVLDRCDAPVFEDDGAGLDGGREQGRVGPVGERHPSVRLEERLLGRVGGDGPARRDLRAGEELVADPACGERPRVLGRDGPKSRPPVVHDQLLAAFGLELAPALQRALGEPHVVRIGVGEAEDPRGTVARAPLVTQPELLHQDDAASCLRKRPGGGDARDSGPDHDDVGIAAHLVS